MSFSQSSFSFGEQTLFQLDMCEGNVKCNGKNELNNNNKPIASMTNRAQKLLSVESTSVKANNQNHQSPSPRLSNGNAALDVIDESPTEKTNLLGKSIRERLKNASTSKKSDRKYMRRSRSDPINGANNSKRSGSMGSFERYGLSEDTDLFLDSTMEWDEMKDARTINQKSKISQKLDDKFENDDFDKYLNDIQTPNIRREQSVHGDQAKNNSLIVLCDSDEMDVEMEMDEVNVTEVERLMQTEKFDKTAEQLTEKTQEHLNDGIEWEDSAYFNELLASQRNNKNDTAMPVEQVDNPESDAIVDPECISMQSGQPDAIEEELESCFLEVSLELSNLNATHTKSEIPKMGTQLDSSICSRSFTTQRSTKHVENNCSKLPKPINHRSIDNLIEWNCSAAIIKAYKKKGILEMFEWQVECLSHPKVIANQNHSPTIPNHLLTFFLMMLIFFFLNR